MVLIKVGCDEMQKAFRLLSEMFLASVDIFVRMMEFNVFFLMLDHFPCVFNES